MCSSKYLQGLKRYVEMCNKSKNFMHFAGAGQQVDLCFLSWVDFYHLCYWITQLRSGRYHIQFHLASTYRILFIFVFGNPISFH
ncbi:hypothetical protein Y032_0004g1715 [Ancylostoma ceylanicum]|uniref:Uncharacterized protein n=1 Tax=Ancylostoma ceylanicum TaxID=53326 RepID=A0A016VTE8_9BILA|nr:hypothetical protein Y032_0004g1715 [Ancylostoma ceylanicum]